MLGHESVSVRVGGLHCLHLLANKHMETHGGEVRDVFTAFADVRKRLDNSASGDGKAYTALDGRYTGHLDYVVAAACAERLNEALEAAGLE